MGFGNFFKSFREDIYAAILEFIGTTLWLIVGLGGIQAGAFSAQNQQQSSVTSVPSIGQLLYISASMGLSLLVFVWLFYRVTGGVFNPAISTGLLLVGAIKPIRWAMYCVAEVTGAIAASAILLALLPGPLAVNTTPAKGINLAQAVFIEAFLTSSLVFAVLMLAAEKHPSTPFAPIGIGLTLFAGHLWGVVYTGAAMNPARAFGPAVVSGFDHKHWVYWVGPLVGSLVATLLYSVLKHINYWNLNPDQDVPDPTKSPRNPFPRLLSNSTQKASTLSV
ncbi:aquaporin, Major intrinsic protein family [Ceratobasidium sp. AG-Ba]|nr:aquaporin, Major intrinsic protein family [Ceratobasidium sp. AG-Ba]